MRYLVGFKGRLVPPLLLICLIVGLSGCLGPLQDDQQELEVVDQWQDAMTSPPYKLDYAARVSIKRPGENRTYEIQPFEGETRWSDWDKVHQRWSRAHIRFYRDGRLVEDRWYATHVSNDTDPPTKIRVGDETRKLTSVTLADLGQTRAANLTNRSQWTFTMPHEPYEAVVRSNATMKPDAMKGEAYLVTLNPTAEDVARYINALFASPMGRQPFTLQAEEVKNANVQLTVEFSATDAYQPAELSIQASNENVTVKATTQISGRPRSYLNKP